MTEGETINAAWVDYFAIVDALRPMSELRQDGSVYFVSTGYCRYWADWSDYHDEWLFDPDGYDAGFDETQAIGWLSN